MRFIKIGLLTFSAITPLTAFSEDNIADELNSKELLQEFNYKYPELSTSDNFTKLISHDKSTDIKVFLSKNMPPLDFTIAGSGRNKISTAAVQCNDGEDEICQTVTKNGRIIKQSCECVAGGE